MKRVPRLYVQSSLREREIALDADAVHRLRNVLRLAPGDAVRVFNEASGEFDATIETLAKSRGTLRLGERARKPGRETGPWLVVAAIKRAPLDLLVEKAAELGVAEIHPILTTRTNVERVNVGRLREIAISASEQCERLDPPSIAEPETLPAKLANWAQDRSILLCAEAGDSLPIAQVLSGRDLSAPWAVMTGPEGGFAPAELEMLARHPFVTQVGLGPTILRADTAALAALAVFQALSARGSQAPRAFD
jgi:16S rRNA (uracil1498-N3)-methyltransferase